MIRIASVALPKSPMNLAQGDEVPQIITRRTRQRPSEFLISPAKRLLQHYPPMNGHSQDRRACLKGARSWRVRTNAVDPTIPFSGSASVSGLLPSHQHEPDRL